MTWHDALLLLVFALQLRQEWRQQRWLSQVRREWHGLLRKMDGWEASRDFFFNRLQLWLQKEREEP